MGLFRKSNEKKRYLLEWQHIILDNSPNKLIMNEAQLKQATNLRAENDLRIIHDCMSIISETVKPDVFFSRLGLLKEKASDLVLLEPYVDFSGGLPTDALNEVLEKEQECIYQFIVRYYSHTFGKSQTMKTEKGKKNQFQKFYDSLQPYTDKMNEHNIKYIKYKVKDIL